MFKALVTPNRITVTDKQKISFFLKIRLLAFLFDNVRNWNGHQ